MTPGSFDTDTCREALGDEAIRGLVSLGNEAAERGDELPPIVVAPADCTYWDSMMWGFKQTVVDAAFARRKLRLERMKQ